MADYKFKDMFLENLKNTNRYFGESKYGVIAITCSLSLFKGIFRPIFTLMDKKQDPETKKYAAIREGLTECIAIPLYIAIPLLAEKLAKTVLKTINDNANKRIETNSKFIGTCAAVLAIPVVCNLVQPPIMEWLKKKQDAKRAEKILNIKTTAGITAAPINKPANQINTSVQKPLSVSHSGMRVGM